MSETKSTKSKMVFSTELAYILGLIMLGLGNSMMSHAGFGMGVVISPSYLLHLKISEYLPFFSFGMAGYVFQGLLLLLLFAVTRKFRFSYLLSFATAVLSGFILDTFIFLTGFIAPSALIGRIIFFVCGMMIATPGIALIFKTYITPEAYDLFVKELSRHFSLDINKVKPCFDISCFLLTVVFSFSFFGFWSFRGIGIGTLFSTCLNGLFIALYSKLWNKFFSFEDKLKWRQFFEK